MHVAQVKERAAARRIYDAAKKRGRAAGLVATKWDGGFSVIQMSLHAFLCIDSSQEDKS